MKNIIKLLSILLTIGILLISVSCKDVQKQKDTAFTNEPTGNHTVELHMEGKTYTMQQQELNPQTKLDFENDKLQYVFYTNHSVVSINLNLTGTDILSKGKASYTVPEVNAGPIKVDLSFFNNNRKVDKRTNKRIVFKKGTIEIKKLTKNKLEMIFTGEGSGMTERGGNFPISGTINAILNP